MIESPVRVRFAPSPTGPLHIGGVRTALYNYLFARKNKGTFILRIEDTDQTRYVKEAEDYIIKSLNWCGIQIDEGATIGGEYSPYRQSERKVIYREYADLLVEKGLAYLAFDTEEELDTLRQQAESEKTAFTYHAGNRESFKNSLSLPGTKVKELVEAGTPYVIRFRINPGEILVIRDEVRGKVEVNTDTLDDKVLFKADGFPTYHLANVVDDYLMKISHVIRGEEWLPSTPLHVLLYRAFGWEDSMPGFAHMPLTLKPDGKGKLSKRDGDRLGFPVFPLQWINPETKEISSGYKEAGYLPEAFINILAMLGWNPGTEQELFSMEELIEAFSLERIVKAGSRFDPEKAKWYNHQYLIQQKGRDLALWIQPELGKRGLDFDLDYQARALDLIKERAFLLTELWELSWFLFQAPESYDEQLIRKTWKEGTRDLIKEVKELLIHIDPLTAENLEPALKSFVEKRDIGFGMIMNPLRLMMVGSNMGPSLIHLMEIIGKQEVLSRIDSAFAVLPG